MHKRVHEILRKQEQDYLQSVTQYLKRKESELKSVTDELVYRANTDSYKDILIVKLKKCISKLEVEGHEVLDHVARQKKQMIEVKHEIDDLHSDRTLLYSKAKQSTKMCNDMQKVVKQLNSENEQLK